MILSFILLSPSVFGLKLMLKCCYDVSCQLYLKFNSPKSYCFSVGKSLKFSHTDLYLGPNSIQWSARFKYIGFNYHTRKKLTLNTNVMKPNFLPPVTLC